ncbi:hypothetical protein NE237_008698 [Protea cynaroides]|uniref:Protein kinase domain-containing protein n=1 Tax=Protea cynaroides TaxID=273540 RepID=A0A9Q0KW23_9MAGN|nr:hypothetical protein NE237_008698 [Protea cynaroides]
MGTLGYVAPEYLMDGNLSAWSNVYSFGVVLLEMLTSMRSVDKNRPTGQHHLVRWAALLLLGDNKNLPRILDSGMDGQYPVEAAQKVANLACQCLNPNPEERPTMTQVVETLKMFKVPDEDQEDALLQARAAIAAIVEWKKSRGFQLQRGKLATDRKQEAEKTKAKTDEILSALDIESEITHFQTSVRKKMFIPGIESEMMHVQRSEAGTSTAWEMKSRGSQEKEEEWDQAERILLMDNELTSLPQSPNCPRLLTLLLQGNERLRMITESFFDYMPSLQVLNLSKTRIKSLPSSISKLVSLRELTLHHRERLDAFPSEFGKLKHLQVLDLHGANVNNLPAVTGGTDLP